MTDTGEAIKILAKHARPTIGFGVVAFHFDTLEEMDAAIEELKHEIGDYFADVLKIEINRHPKTDYNNDYFIRIFD